MSSTNVALARSIIFYMVCLFSLQACDIGTRFQGSADEVRSELLSMFPIGTGKERVIAVAENELKLGASKFERMVYEDGPLRYKENNQELLVYSWVEMELLQHRPMNRFFMKTLVVAKFFFDQNDRLNGIKVTLYTDGL